MALNIDKMLKPIWLYHNASVRSSLMCIDWIRKTNMLQEI